jgi:hypothetical protein
LHGAPVERSRAHAFGSAILIVIELNSISVTLAARSVQGGRNVDLALRLNVLAVFAVFAFVGAILLGAF